MNFSISLSDELSEKIILKAAENNITPTHYIEMLINRINYAVLEPLGL